MTRDRGQNDVGGVILSLAVAIILGCLYIGYLALTQPRPSETWHLLAIPVVGISLLAALVMYRDSGATRDRGQKMDGGSNLVAMTIIIAGIVGYVAYDMLGPITYTFELWHLLAIPAVILALLLARGMYLIGQGSDAEFEARAKAADSKVFGSGFFLLDWLRTASLPVLGEGKTQRTYRCGNCRHTFQSSRRAGWPACPNCGDDQPEVIQ